MYDKEAGSSLQRMQNSSPSLFGGAAKTALHVNKFARVLQAKAAASRAQNSAARVEHGDQAATDDDDAFGVRLKPLDLEASRASSSSSMGASHSKT